MPLSIAIHPDDNVAMCVDPLDPGDSTEIVLGSKRYRILASTTIPAGHKIALRNIPKGDNVIKFGHRIGRAAADIHAGDHVHIHNVSGFASQAREN